MKPSNNQEIEVEPWEHSVIRWAGSKRKLLPTLLRNVPDNYHRYIEPFCGSACLFFALRPQKAILSDINSELILTFRQLKRHPRKLARTVREMPVTNEHYVDIRSRDTSVLSDFERATRFIYLNRHCFNGVYRTNRRGEFNVPMGTRTGVVPTEKRFFRSHLALKNATLETKDFEALIVNVQKGDFLYLDPPYAKTKQRDRGEYGPGAFKHDDIGRLIDFLRLVDKKGAKFLLSYSSDDELITQVSENWNVEKIKVVRHVSGFADHRTKVTEVLVSNGALVI